MDLIQLAFTPSTDAVLQNLPKIPRSVRLSSLRELESYLVGLGDMFLHSTLSAADTSELAGILSRKLEVAPAPIKGILQYFRANILTPEVYRFLCQQLAVKYKTLKKGNQIVDLYRGSIGYAWAPFQVINVATRPSEKDYLFCQFTGENPNGIPFTLRVNAGYRFFKGAGLGTKSLRGIRTTPQELLTFKYYALIQPCSHLSPVRDGVVTPLDAKHVVAIRATATQAQYNKTLFKDRQTPCPVGLNLPCSNCFVGLDKCVRACKITTNWAVNVSPPQELTYGR